MNEYDLSPARKYKVGATRQIHTVQAKSEAEMMGDAANRHLRLGIFAADSAH